MVQFRRPLMPASERSKSTGPYSRRPRATKAKTPIAKLMQRNATESPLLRLPAELRNKIWHYVLGGHALHFCDSLDVRSSRSRKNYHIYVFPIAELDETKAETIREHSKNPETNVYREERIILEACDLLKPPNWVPEDPDVLSLDLLRTCRQIYQETKLVPFRANTFSFLFAERGMEMRELLKVLTLKQVAAIRSMSITLKEMSCTKTPRAWHDEISPNFTGLRQLTVFCGYPTYTVLAQGGFWSPFLWRLPDTIAQHPSLKARICLFGQKESPEAPRHDFLSDEVEANVAEIAGWCCRELERQMEIIRTGAAAAKRVLRARAQVEQMEGRERVLER